MLLYPRRYGSGRGYALWNVAERLADLLAGQVALLGLLPIHLELSCVNRRYHWRASEGRGFSPAVPEGGMERAFRP
jgi:hypothetical protein